MIRDKIFFRSDQDAGRPFLAKNPGLKPVLLLC